MNKKKEDDTLKQLEKLLTDDAQKNEDDYKGSTKTDFIGITIRLSVSLALILILYFTGIFDRPIYISLALLFIVSIEIIRYFKGKKERPRFPG
jgi:hypothetical protein